MPASSATTLPRPANRVPTGSVRAVTERASPAAALTLAVVRSTAAGAAVARLTRTLRSGGATAGAGGASGAPNE